MRPDQRGSRTFLTAILLTLAGGYLDAYTYFVRGGVFANAQTGNVVRFAIALAQSDLDTCLFCLVPILAFSAGVLLSLIIEDVFSSPRRVVLSAEIVLLTVISFLPVTKEMNILANVMVSFVCAMQMQTFQIFRNQGIATTVATGNLRRAAETLYRGIRTKDRVQVKTSLQITGIVLVFIAGVMLGTVLSSAFGAHSVLVPAILLTAAFAHITVIYERFRKNRQTAAA